MTTAAAAKDADTKAPHGDAGAILFELEGLASQGREAMFDILRKIIASHDGKLTPSIYARYGLQPRVDFYAEDLIEKSGAKKLSAASLVESANAEIASHLSSGKTTLFPAFSRLLEAGQKVGLEAGAISALPAEIAQNVLNNLGLSDRGVKLFPFADVENSFPRADVWLKVAKQMGKSPRACVVVTDHMSAFKSALAAGMKCVAVPGTYSAHQDYCGADVILDTWDELSAKDIIEAVVPA